MQINLQQLAWAKNTLTYLIGKFTETFDVIRSWKKELNGHFCFISNMTLVSVIYIVNYLQ